MSYYGLVRPRSLAMPGSVAGSSGDTTLSFAALHTAVALHQAQHIAALDTISREYDRRMATALRYRSKPELITSYVWSDSDLLDQKIDEFAAAAYAGDHPQHASVYL